MAELKVAEDWPVRTFCSCAPSGCQFKGSVTFLPRSQSEKKYYASPVELQRARSGSDGIGLSPPIIPAALAAMRPTRSRMGLHEEGCHVVVVHEAHESRSLRPLHSSS